MTDPLPKRIWLFLLREGGWWTAGAIQDALGLERHDNVYAAVRRMSYQGMLERNVPSERGKVITYSVTSACRVPDNVVYSEILECLSEVA